jgi:haloalkane dehalogenase
MKEHVMTGAEPYGKLQYKEIDGKRMAYVDEGHGDAIVFQHGNPTSSYLWRNVMPHLEGLGRLVACDLIGMGGSDKLDDPGPDSYHYREHRDYLFALWEALDLGDRLTFVLHDWGGALGFDWANQHRDRVVGIAYMESVAVPMEWSDFPADLIPLLQDFRSSQGETLALENNMFVEGVLPNSILRSLSDEEMTHYREPFRRGGEDRRPTLSWPRDIPISGEPADVVAAVTEFGPWVASSDVPKLFINAEPGLIQTGRVLDAVRKWANQTEITVPGAHFIQEDSADAIGEAVASFVRKIRADAQKYAGTGSPALGTELR